MNSSLARGQASQNVPAVQTGPTTAIPVGTVGSTGIVPGGVVVGGTLVTGGILLTTPEASLETPQPVAGISDAGRAGITNSSPVNNGVFSTLNSPTLVYSNLPVVNPGAVSQATAAVSEGRLIYDLGPSFYSDTVAAPSTSGLSLAEVAASYKGRHTSQTTRTYTNADVPPSQNAGQSGGTTMAANIQLPVPQASAPRSVVAPATPAQSQSGGNRPEGQSPSAAKPTTPQVKQAQPAAQSETTALPATSTFLPLLGLLGIAASSIGIWYRRHRR